MLLAIKLSLSIHNVNLQQCSGLCHLAWDGHTKEQKSLRATSSINMSKACCRSASPHLSIYSVNQQLYINKTVENIAFNCENYETIECLRVIRIVKNFHLFATCSDCLLELNAQLVINFVTMYGRNGYKIHLNIYIMNKTLSPIKFKKDLAIS